MDRNTFSHGYNGQYEVGNGANGYSDSSLNGDSYERSQPLSLEEALPYSPFSSVVPFNSGRHNSSTSLNPLKSETELDMIPIPTIGLHTSTSLFPTPTDRDTGRKDLDSLGREASNPYQTSQKLQQSLNDLRQLLRSDEISTYTFQLASRTKPTQGTHEQPQITLSPFARMVFDNTKLNFKGRESVQIKPEHTPKVAAHKNQYKVKVESQHGDYIVGNKSAYDANSTVVPRATNNNHSSHSLIAKPSLNQIKSNISIQIPTLPDSFKREEYISLSEISKENDIEIVQSLPAQLVRSDIESSALVRPLKLSTTPAKPSKIEVVIPDSSQKINPLEYPAIPESPGSPLYLSRKRSRDDEDLSTVLDQRERADAAFRNLRDYLQDIFEADDQFQQDTSIDSSIFVMTHEGASLSTEVQIKLEGLLQKIIEIGRFNQVPIEDLIRVQKLSEGAIKEAENIELKLDDTMNESNLESWFQQLNKAELALRAAKTSLRLMTGKREEKHIYSEDLIQLSLNAFRSVVDDCIIPVVEMRSSGTGASMFKILSAQKKHITSLLSQCRRLLTILSTLVAQIELSDTVINTLEFTASRLIFVENAPFERDSVLGISKFDSLRVVAMDVLANIFLSCPEQRQAIFDEILTSLEKLPVTKQSARQFKLAEGGSIQLVSALIMRLVQTSATKSVEAKEKRRNRAMEALEDEPDELQQPTDVAYSSVVRPTIDSEKRAEIQVVSAIQELKETVSPLLDTAKANASYVVSFIVNRAMNSTKSGDAPYRNLLDLFVEDFITCMNSTDWPAAELLLRLFLFRMVHLAEGDKTPTPAKNMALDLLGLMGAAISELNSQVRKSAAALHTGDGGLNMYLSRLAEDSLEKIKCSDTLVSWTGPFRTSLEYLETRASSDPQLSSAISFHLAEWGARLCTAYDLSDCDGPDDTHLEAEYGRVAFRLRMMVTDNLWLSTEYTFGSVSVSQARLAYALTLLHSQFCESFGRVLTILLSSITSEHAVVRSKSLKSINQVLETNPNILDREPAVKHLILRCSNDSSVQVRDSALGLIGKCLSLRPSLEEEMTPSILQRVNDSGVGVRKRAMKLSKEIYLGNSNKDVRSAIADSLLHRVTDQDEGVQDLARQSIEEVWMSPFHQSTSTENTSAQFKLAMAEHVVLMIKTVQRGSGVASVLDKVLQSMLSSESKSAAANFRVCKDLVSTMFETIIDNPTSESSDAPSARDALQVLTIFAKSNAKLFTAEQIQLLQPYVANVGGGDDLAVYRSVVVIFRHVLPELSKAHNSFLISVRKELIPAVSRMSRIILDDVVACLWIISEVLDDFQHLTRLVISSLAGIQKISISGLAEPRRADEVRKLNKLLMISGMCGKHCDLDPQHGNFKAVFPKWKDTSVSKLMCDVFAPFASSACPLEVRKAALDAVGMVCQSWPKNFSSVSIYTAFQLAFQEKEQTLEAIVLRAFKDFLLSEEKRSEAGSETTLGTAADPTATLGVMGGGQGDGVAIAIAQRFMADITRIALASQDDQALLATEVLTSINRQGLVHPKESALALIALETSQNSKIADLSFKAHRALHEKHETILEKEYMRAVQAAYMYQRDVVHNTHGATLDPYASKLWMMIDVLKISKVKNRKKFFDGLCSRIDFDSAKMNIIKDLPHHLEFSQFIIENLAFFEYVTMDELLSTLVSMEKVVAGMGTSIAHAIETEVLGEGRLTSQQPDLDENGQPKRVEVMIGPIRLKQLAACSMMLSSLWNTRTFLRRQYGLLNRPNLKGKGGGSNVKDLNKAPIKLTGTNIDRFWDENLSTMTALDSNESMIQRCRSFVQLLNYDQDFKIAAEADDESMKPRYGTPSDEDEDDPLVSGGTTRGRKRKPAPSGTPGGRKKRARSGSISRGPNHKGKAAGRNSVDSGGEEGMLWN